MRSSAMPLAEDAAAPERGLIATVELAPRQRASAAFRRLTLPGRADSPCGWHRDRPIHRPLGDPKVDWPGAGLHVSPISDPSPPDARSHGGARGVRCTWGRLASLSILRHGARRPGAASHRDGPTGMGSRRCPRRCGASHWRRASEQAASRESRLGSWLTLARLATAVPGTRSRAGRSRSSPATCMRSSRVNRSRRRGSSRFWHRRSTPESSITALSSESRAFACVSRLASPKASGAGRVAAIPGLLGCLAASGPVVAPGSSSGSSRRSHRWPRR